MPLNLTLNSLDLDPHGVIIVNGEEVNPLIYLDFVNEVYTVNGSIAALNTILIQDANFGDWNPARIVNGTGLVGNTDTAPVFTGDTLALIVGGSTILASVTTSWLGSGGQFRFELVDSPDYNTYYAFLAQLNPALFSAINDNTNTENLPPLADGTHKIALTMSEGHIAVSIDGAATTVIDPADPWTPDVAIMNMIVRGGVTLKNIGLYPEQDDADLPGLSAP